MTDNLKLICIAGYYNVSCGYFMMCEVHTVILINIQCNLIVLSYTLNDAGRAYNPVISGDTNVNIVSPSSKKKKL